MKRSDFSFYALKDDFIETEKAFGVKYSVSHDYSYSNKEYGVVWLPKSQTTITELEPYYDENRLFSEEEIKSGVSNWVEVSIPNWLAYKNNFFKNNLLKETSI